MTVSAIAVDGDGYVEAVLTLKGIPAELIVPWCDSQRDHGRRVSVVDFAPAVGVQVMSPVDEGVEP